MAKSKISKTQQNTCVIYIQETFDNYKILNESRREELYNIYKEYRSFKQEKLADWSSTFKVNKAHEIVNKILPRVIAKNPRWIVNLRSDAFNEDDEVVWGLEREERLASMQEMADWVQDYLTYIFDRYNLKEPIRLWAKDMLIYWKAHAKIKYKYEVARVRDENWTIEEKVIGEYPTIESKKWSDIYTDPRYVLLEDAPALIELTHNVRLADLKRKKDKYFNLDKIEKLPSSNDFQNDPDSAKARIFEVTGIPAVDQKSGWVDKDTLTMRTFYGKYAVEWQDERLYRIITVNDMIMIDFEEITCIPFEDIKAFDDTETANAVWLVEPILSLQEELNFKKNSASEYINQSLNRSFIWSPNSWVNPADLNSRPNNIIATTKDATTAMANVVELPHRDINSGYFGEQNDIERQIQAQTFTVDTTANKSNQALTNTATWARIKFFESNTVIDELRKHFEEWLERLAYKLLESTYENMESNIVIKKQGTTEFWEVNKELLRDAFNRYDIKIEVNSSSFDDVADRRDEAMALMNILTQSAQLWVPVDFEEALKDIIGTFEKRDPNKFIKSPEKVQQEQELMQQQAEAQQVKQLEQQEQPWESPSDITKQVAGWDLTTWI